MKFLKRIIQIIKETKMEVEANKKNDDIGSCHL